MRTYKFPDNSLGTGTLDLIVGIGTLYLRDGIVCILDLNIGIGTLNLRVGIVFSGLCDYFIS